MRSIANKIETLRTAQAEARVRMRPETLQRLQSGDLPKGDPRPLAKAAAIMAAKKTSDLIPYCHPILIDHVSVEFELLEDSVVIKTQVTAVAKTGVEMEALTAASIAALTIYDMLKPIDKDLEILNCRLLDKKGGKSSFPAFVPKGFRAAVIVTSDGVYSSGRASASTAAGTREDKSGKIIREALLSYGIQEVAYCILPDDVEQIQNQIAKLCHNKCPLILTTGGTGLGPRDVTVEATRKIIEREVPGISEAMRGFGQRRTPYAMLSRGLAGIRDRSLIINLPGSSKGVEESMAAIFPYVFHLFPITEGEGH